MIQTSITLNEEAITDWQEYREFIKKPLSEFALKRSIKILERHDFDHQMFMVDKAISNDWTGLHDVDQPKNKPQPTGDTSWLTTENRSTTYATH